VEHKRTKDNKLSGFTDNYIPVVFPGEDKLMGQVTQVSLTEIEDGVVQGIQVEN
jgi:tRNA A37 methylthiotransferase MiaB